MSKYKYKQVNTLQKRLKIFEDEKKKKPNSRVLIVEKDPKCAMYPELTKSSFSIDKSQKIIQIYHAIRKRIVEIDKKYENQSLFLFTSKKIPNKETSIEDLYTTEKDKEDGLLYLYYSNMEPFGWSN